MARKQQELVVSVATASGPRWFRPSHALKPTNLAAWTSKNEMPLPIHWPSGSGCGVVFYITVPFCELFYTMTHSPRARVLIHCPPGGADGCRRTPAGTPTGGEPYLHALLHCSGRENNRSFSSVSHKYPWSLFLNSLPSSHASSMARREGWTAPLVEMSQAPVLQRRRAG